MERHEFVIVCLQCRTVQRAGNGVKGTELVNPSCSDSNVFVGIAALAKFN